MYRTTIKIRGLDVSCKVFTRRGDTSVGERSGVFVDDYEITHLGSKRCKKYPNWFERLYGDDLREAINKEFEG